MQLSGVPRTRTTAALAVLTGVLAIGGCSSSQGSGDHVAGPASSASFGPSAKGPHGQADSDFASQMIPHHQQAVEMATIALTRSGNPGVKALATAIKGAQAPEIKQLSGWLAGWGGTVPSGSAHGAGGHDMKGMSGTGMMSDSEMQQLSTAVGAAFDRLWLEQMTKHHQGAVSMARTEVADGINAEAKALAQQIIAAQSKEISTMAALLPTIRS